MYRLLNVDGRARRGEFKTVHGIIQTQFYECRNFGCD